MESQILQHQYLARFEFNGSALGFLADAVGSKNNFMPDIFGQSLGDIFHTEINPVYRSGFLVNRMPEMSHNNHFGLMFRQIFQSRNDPPYPEIAFNLAV